MKNIKGFENYTITQDGVITNTNTKKSLKHFDGKVKLTRDGERFTYFVVDLISDHYNDIILKEYLGVSSDLKLIKDMYVSEDNTEIKTRFLFDDFTGYDVTSMSMIDVRELIENDKSSPSILDRYEEFLPHAYNSYAKEQRALKIDGINYKSIEEFPGVAISIDKKIFRIEDSMEIVQNRGKAKCNVNKKLYIIDVEKVFSKYFS